MCNEMKVLDSCLLHDAVKKVAIHGSGENVHGGLRAKRWERYEN